MHKFYIATALACYLHLVLMQDMGYYTWDATDMDSSNYNMSGNSSNASHPDRDSKRLLGEPSPFDFYSRYDGFHMKSGSGINPIVLGAILCVIWLAIIVAVFFIQLFRHSRSTKSKAGQDQECPSTEDQTEDQRPSGSKDKDGFVQVNLDSDEDV